jgi:hypothetical protein
MECGGGGELDELIFHAKPQRSKEITGHVLRLIILAPLREPKTKNNL